MLLRSSGEHVVAITQPFHAWIAGELAAAWGTDGFPVPAPRDAVIRAAGIHDIGCLDWDRAPRLDRRTGLPMVFQAVPPAVHVGLWRDGVARAPLRRVHRAAGLAARRRGLRARGGPRPRPPPRGFDVATAPAAEASIVRAFLDDQARFQEAVIARLADDPILAPAVTAARLALTKAFLLSVDTLSLHFCWGREGLIADVPRAGGDTACLTLKATGGDGLIVDPWPFARDTMALTVEGREIVGRARDQDELDRMLAAAPSWRRTMTLKPP